MWLDHIWYDLIASSVDSVMEKLWGIMYLLSISLGEWITHTILKGMPLPDFLWFNDWIIIF